jgi:RhtB (resistance to homoserine/threonine) family protein
MSSLSTLASLAAVHWLAMLSPGPNVLVVAQTAMSHSRAAGIAAALGVAAGAGVLATAATVGLRLVTEQSSALRHGLQVAGGCYLVYLGASMWLGAQSPARAPARGEAFFLRGLLTNLSNPKAAVFFGSVVGATLGPASPDWVRAAAVVVIVADACVWHCIVAVMFAKPAVRDAYVRRRRTIDRVVGAALGAIGIVLALGAL